MQQGGGGGLGQQFGLHPPKMPPFSPAGSTGQRISVAEAEAPSPINSRPPVSAIEKQVVEEQGPGGGFDEEAPGAGEEGASGSAAGNRWPRQETLALLKIRSDMDATFRDAILKGPLWEEVSRKLADEGYNRSSKKCKEKFENVHKYYKRTKDSRAGRNDGKTYRFFQELEALHGTGAGAAATAAAPVATFALPAMAVGVSGVVGSSSVRAPAEPPPVGAAGAATVGCMPAVPVLVAGNMSFSTSSTKEYSDEEDSDGEGTEEMGGADERGKRKRMSKGGAAAAAGSAGGSGKMMRFFEGLIKQVIERQETMQQWFLETIEKREQDRVIREEAWRRQKMARLAREQEILAQDRAMAASRDAAVLSFIKKMTGQSIPMPSIPATAMITFLPPPSHPHPTPIASAAPAPPPSQPSKSHSQPHQSSQTHKAPVLTAPLPLPQQESSMDIVMTPSESFEVVVRSGCDGPGSGGPASSRWPKAEVDALIHLRSNLDMRYQEAGPKGPLWEEISAGMRRMGYNRSSKRCKEKWENINKYYKKVKDSNKKRPEDSKTCPYFHQLEVLYRNKGASSSPTGGGAATLQTVEHANATPQERAETFTVAAPISQTATQPHVTKNDDSTNSSGKGNSGCSGGSSGLQMPASNGSVPAATSFLGEAGVPTVKKETMEQRQLHQQVVVQQQQQEAINSYNRTGGAADSNSIDDDKDGYHDEDDDEDDANKMQYEIQFQRQQQQQPHHNVVGPNAAAATGGGNPPGASAPSMAAAATTTAGSFLGMVQ